MYTLYIYIYTHIHYVYIHIYIYVYILRVPRYLGGNSNPYKQEHGQALGWSRTSSQQRNIIREFKDVVFEDVVFDNNIFDIDVTI